MSVEVTGIPLSLLFARMHNLDHLSALILPTVTNVAGVFIPDALFREPAEGINRCGHRGRYEPLLDLEDHRAAIGQARAGSGCSGYFRE